MFTERKEQMKVFQNFVKRFKDFFFMYAIGSRLGVMKVKQCKFVQWFRVRAFYLSNQ